MLTHVERAQRLMAYVRTAKDGRVYLSGEYIGRIRPDGVMTLKGQRWIGIPSADPLYLVAAHIAR